MPDKRNHHYLPQLYQQGFVSDTEVSHIWEYERGRDYLPGKYKRFKYNPVLLPITKAGAKDGFYAYDRSDGTTDFNTYEDKLEQLEKPANPVFDKIRNTQPINDSEREVFTEYMLTMIRRVPNRKVMVKEQFPTVLEEEERRIKAELERALSQADSIDINRITQIHQRLNEIFESYKQNGMPHEMELKILVESAMPRMRAAMLSMKWQFFIAPPGQRFVTSDNPVHIFQGGVGLNKPYSELTFPVSSLVVLIGSYRNVPQGYLPGSSQLVKEINRRVIANATTNAYSSLDEKWVVTLLEKKFHRFNLIYPAPELSAGVKV